MTTKNERNQKYKQAAAKWALRWFNVVIDLNDSVHDIWEQTTDLYLSQPEVVALDSNPAIPPPPPPPPHG